MGISWESGALSGVCLADLLSTLFWVQYRGAAEGNPLMAFYLAHGIAAFVCAKVLLCVPPLYLAEYARLRSPRFVRLSLRAAFACYLLAYAGGVMSLNGF